MAAMLRDCILGQAVADALGVPYEFRARGTFTCTDMVGFGSHHQPAGTWSDDTSMALCICDSFRELGRIDTEDIRHRFVRWYREGAYTVDGLFDIGGACARALDQGHGCAEEWDNGNGSLMRTVPLAFTDATDDEVRAVSAITHAHPTSTELCVALVRIARELVRGAAPCDAVPDAAALAVNLGDDTDTTAAVAGALAGIVYGADAIPARWLGALRGRDVIEACLF